MFVQGKRGVAHPLDGGQGDPWHDWAHGAQGGRTLQHHGRHPRGARPAQHTSLSITVSKFLRKGTEWRLYHLVLETYLL